MTMGSGIDHCIKQGGGEDEGVRGKGGKRKRGQREEREGEF
jgi:hypothetical protein